MTNEVVDATLMRIGEAILNDSELYDDWVSLEVVFTIDSGVVGHHAAMKVENESEEISFLLSSNSEAEQLIPRLQAATINEDGTSWVACKIDLIRATKDLKVRFEYQDEKRWDPVLPF